MIPTTILLECGVCEEAGRPIDLQPQLAHPMAQRWRDVRRVFDETVGGVPIYVMSLSNEGRVVGAWDMLQNTRPLISGAVRLFQENPQAQFALAGPVAASECVIMCGNEPFRRAADMAVKDALGDHHIRPEFFMSDGSEVRSAFTDLDNAVRWMTAEDAEDAKARIFRELDRVEAMYDGRIPMEMRQYRQRLRQELRDLIELTDGDGEP
jgi:hypothetical protein